MKLLLIRATAMLVVVGALTAPRAALAGPVDGGVHTDVPTTGILIEFAEAHGDGTVSCIVQARAAWARTSVLAPEDSENTTIRGVLAGNGVAQCSAARETVYRLVQVDADLIDIDTGTEYGDGATPCNFTPSCTDVSEPWLVETLPARYRVDVQVTIMTVLPMSKIGGPCSLLSSTVAQCVVSRVDRLDP